MKPLIGAIAAPGLHVMSLNIRRRTPSAPWRSADQWDHRAPRLRALLQSERPALLGVQEAIPSQASFVLDALGSHFRFVGHGRRADGSGEGCPLYFDADRLELLAWDQTALSDQPTVPGSVSWGNLIPRIAVSGTFRDRATSVCFVVVNTHFDHVSRRSRRHSAQAVRELATRQGLPAVITGDLNTGEGTAPIRELLSGGQLTDAWARAQTRDSAEWGTFANYRPPRRGRKRIDWVAVSENIEVTRAAINPRRYAGGWPSDHLPMQAVVLMPEGTDCL